MIAQLHKRNHQLPNSPLLNASYDSMALKQAYSSARPVQNSSIKAQNNYLISCKDTTNTKYSKELYKNEITKQIKEKNELLITEKKLQKQPQNGFFPNGTEQFKKKFEKFYNKKVPDIITQPNPVKESNGMLMLPSMNDQTKKMLHGLYYETPKGMNRTKSVTKGYESLGSTPKNDTLRSHNIIAFKDNTKLEAQQKTKIQSEKAKEESLNKSVVEKAMREQKDLTRAKASEQERIKKEKLKEIEQIESAKQKNNHIKRIQDSMQKERIRTERQSYISDEDMKRKKHLDDMRQYKETLESQARAKYATSNTKATKLYKEKIIF